MCYVFVLAMAVAGDPTGPGGRDALPGERAAGLA